MTGTSNTMALWTCYSDGACQPSNPGPCGWGAVVLPPGGGTIENAGYLGHGTNQIAEVSAALHALEMTPVGAEVLLISDSQYALKGLTEWRRGWERNGFQNAKREPVANLELWKRLFAVADQRRVRTQWVKGHSGDKHNERCDVLAVEAVRARRIAGKTSVAPAAAMPATRPPVAPTPARTIARPTPASGTLGDTWTPISSLEPERQTVLYGLVESGGTGPKIVRAESGYRLGPVRTKLWATHWMWLPELSA
jgi:ribonuclease HI